MLPGNAVDHLHAVVGEWQLLADLSFADYLMWVARDDGALVCVAQCRPNTAPTVLITDAVGTLVAAGDLPLVTAVGVVNADVGLHLPDFRSGERTFSLLTQVVGRAGRGGSAGRAVIQTYTPENDVIQYAARQDYQGFYEREIRMRRLRRFPPFADLFTFTVSGCSFASTLSSASFRLRNNIAWYHVFVARQNKIFLTTIWIVFEARFSDVS